MIFVIFVIGIAKMWAELQFPSSVCFFYSNSTWKVNWTALVVKLLRVRVCFNWILSRAYKCEYRWTHGKISVAGKRRLWIVFQWKNGHWNGGSSRQTRWSNKGQLKSDYRVENYNNVHKHFKQGTVHSISCYM